MESVGLNEENRYYINHRQIVAGIIGITSKHCDEIETKKIWEIMCGNPVENVSTLPTGIIMKFLEEFLKKISKFKRIRNKN